MNNETLAVIGYGSIGKRHAENLSALRPGARVLKVDPVARHGVDYASLDELLDRHPLLDGALICSPHETHLEALARLSESGVPVYLEKPVCGVEQWRSARSKRLMQGVTQRSGRVGIGFQYRYNTVADRLLPLTHEIYRLDFIAQDSLAMRYGPTVLETMASHSIDLALFLLGPAASVALRTDGLRVHGKIVHRSTVESHYRIEMDVSPRESYVTARFERQKPERLTIDAEQWMYQRCLSDWLRWALDGERTDRLATLRDGLAVQDVMCEARAINAAKRSKAREPVGGML